MQEAKRERRIDREIAIVPADGDDARVEHRGPEQVREDEQNRALAERFYLNRP